MTRKINVRDMLFFIVEKSYVLIIVGILFAVIFGINYYFTFDDDYVLNDEIIKKLDNVFSIEEEYMQYVASDEKSKILSMDTNDYYLMRITFKIEDLSLDSTVYDKIKNEIESEEFKTSLLDNSDLRIDSISLGYLSEPWSLDVDDGTLILYDFYTDNYEEADIICKLAKTSIDEIGKKYIDREKKGKWLFVEDWIKPCDDEDYLENRVTNFEQKYENLKEKYEKSKEKLSNVELMCYKKYYLNEEIKVNKISLVKKMLTGFFLGTFLSALIVSALYIFSDKIKTVEEIKDVYGLAVIGVINKKEKTNKRKFLENKRYRFDDIDFVRAFLETLPEKTAIFYDDSNTDIQEIAKEISVSGSVYPLIHTNSETQKECLKYEKAVILIELNNMEHREFDREMEVCNMQGIDVAGIIAVV